MEFTPSPTSGSSFISKFSGYTEPYFFYDGTIELRYEPENHVYYRVENGEFIKLAGVTTVTHIIDKSPALMAWACKQMAERLLETTPKCEHRNDFFVPPSVELPWTEYEKLVLAAKTAYKEKTEEAADIGHQAHEWIEWYIKSVLAGDDARKEELLAKLPEDNRAASCCIAAISWMAKHNVRWLSTEKKIYSKWRDYAGTMDGLAHVDSCDDPKCCPHAFKDRLSLIDWKSSNYLYIEYLFQTAAYQGAYEDEHDCTIEDRWVIRLGKYDAEFDPWHLEGRELFKQDYNGFLACLELVRIVEAVEDRMQIQKDFIKETKKAEKKAAKEAQLMIKCKSADKYKGIRPPQCNGGNPCQTCLTKYEARQREKAGSTAHAPGCDCGFCKAGWTNALTIIG